MTQSNKDFFTPDGALDVLAVEASAHQLRGEATRAFFASLFGAFKSHSRTSHRA